MRRTTPSMIRAQNDNMQMSFWLTSYYVIIRIFRFRVSYSISSPFFLRCVLALPRESVSVHPYVWNSSERYNGITPSTRSESNYGVTASATKVPLDSEAALASVIFGEQNALTTSCRKTAASALRPDEMVDKEALQTQAMKSPARPGKEDENTSMMYKGAN